jgi:hypothetical protein
MSLYGAPQSNDWQNSARAPQHQPLNKLYHMNNPERGGDSGVDALSQQFGNFQVSNQPPSSDQFSESPMRGRGSGPGNPPPHEPQGGCGMRGGLDEGRDWDEPVTPYQADLNARYPAAGPLNKRGQHATYSPGPPIQTSRYLQGPEGER